MPGSAPGPEICPPRRNAGAVDSRSGRMTRAIAPESLDKGGMGAECRRFGGLGFKWPVGQAGPARVEIVNYH